MNDRDQAQEELLALWGDELWFTDSTERLGILDFFVAHPDLVLRALGMEPCDREAGDSFSGTWVWVEPPTDQDSQESS